jgi:hypothetical protein
VAGDNVRRRDCKENGNDCKENGIFCKIFLAKSCLNDDGGVLRK